MRFVWGACRFPSWLTYLIVFCRVRAFRRYIMIRSKSKDLGVIAVLRFTYSRKQMPFLGIDPTTFWAEAESLGSELSSHIGESYPLPYMDLEALLYLCRVVCRVTLVTRQSLWGPPHALVLVEWSCSPELRLWWMRETTPKSVLKVRSRAICRRPRWNRWKPRWLPP